MIDYLRGVATCFVLLGIIAWHVFVELPLEEESDE